MISDRLQRALKKADVSLKELHARLTRAGYDVSYGSVYNYVKGERAAPTDFLEAVARELNLRPAYLAFGEEPETPEKAGIEGVSGDTPFEADMGRSVGKYVPELDYASRQTQVLFVHTVWRYIMSFEDWYEELGLEQSAEDGSRNDDAVDWEGIAGIARYVADRLFWNNMWGVRSLPGEEWDTSVLASAAAFTGVLHPPGKGPPIRKLLWYETGSISPKMRARHSGGALGLEALEMAAREKREGLAKRAEEIRKWYSSASPEEEADQSDPADEGGE